MLSFSLATTLNSCDQGVEPIPKCNAAVLDTTSHAFTWTITELGDGGGSILRDVAIINDTLIYAIGELYLKDSTGQIDPLPYNAVIWNGSSWAPKRISVVFRGSTITPPLEGIFSFSSQQIWLVGSLPIYGDGSMWTMYDLRTTLDPNVSVSKAWGQTANNVFFVGRGGSIVHFTNGIWQKLSSGTTFPIRDVWGAKDPVTGKQTVLAIASGSFPEDGKKLLSIDGTTVSSLSDEGLSWSLSGVWFVPNCRYYIVGAGIHQKASLRDPVWTVYPPGEVTSYGSTAVYGQSLNDVFVVGSFLEIAHFNGSTWYNYRKEIPLTDGVIADVDIKGNSVVLVGYLNQRALIITGRR